MSGIMTAATTENHVWFGSGASAGTQIIWFDYLRYNAHNVLPPGQGDGRRPVTVTCTGPLGIDRATVNAYAVPSTITPVRATSSSSRSRTVAATSVSAPSTRCGSAG